MINKNPNEYIGIFILTKAAYIYPLNKILIMEEIEIPTEHLHETIHEHAEEESHGGGHGNEKGWSMYVAISTAIIAVLAAITGLMAGHHSNEAMMAQIKSSDQWAFYQAKGIKAEIKTLEVMNGKAEPSAVDKYKKEQEEIKKQAQKLQEESEAHLSKHVVLARSVTFFQIAIAISAIAILTKRKSLWYMSLAIAAAGAFFFCSELFF